MAGRFTFSALNLDLGCLWIEDWIGYQGKENPGNEDHLASTGKHYHPPRPYALVFS